MYIFCPSCLSDKTSNRYTQKTKLKIRTSQEITPTLKEATAYCPNCFRQIRLSIHITKIQEVKTWSEDKKSFMSNSRISLTTNKVIKL